MSRESALNIISTKEDEVIDFLKKVISIRSENGGDEDHGTKELEIQNFLADYLRAEGFEVDLFAADPEGVRFNTVATLKGKNPGTGKSLILMCHTDTVPVTELEKWNVDPFNEGEHDGRIYGRGANDMKGGLAAAVWAAKAVKDAGADIDGDVILLLTCGEESSQGETIGARACIERGYRAPFAICCEPTSDEIHNATASLLCFDLTISGKAIHSCCRNRVIFPQSGFQNSAADVGVDSVEKALPFLEFFYRLEKEWNHRWKKSAVGHGGRPGHDRQGIGAFNINPSFINSGEYIAAVPGCTKITYAVWYPPEVDAEDIMAEIEERVHCLAQTDDWLREHPPVIERCGQWWPGYVVPEESEPVAMLKQAFRDSLGREAVISGFRAVCDGTWLMEDGIPTVVLGPGALDDGGHGYNEFVSRQEVIDAAKVYVSFIYDWCN